MEPSLTLSKSVQLVSRLENHDRVQHYEDLSTNTKTSLRHKIMLTMAFFGLGSASAFVQIYMTLSQQYLGVPVFLVSASSTISGFLGFILLPLLGSLVDIGSHPRQRKMLATIGSMLVISVGYTFLLASSLLKLQTSGRAEQFLKQNTSNNVTYVNMASTDLFDTPTAGVLAILAYAFIILGFLIVSPIMRAYIVDHVSQQDQSGLLIMVTFMTASGGTSMSVLGYFDIPTFLESAFNVDGMAAMLLVFSIGQIIMLGFTLSCTILTARSLGAKQQKHFETPETDNLNTEVKTEKHKLVSKEMHSEESPILGVNKHTPIDVSTWSIFMNKRLVVLCISCFLAVSANNSFGQFVSNALTVGVYHGDPYAEVGTEAYSNFEKGQRNSALGSLCMYMSYLIATSTNIKLFELIGERIYFMICNMFSLAVGIAFLTLKSEELFFLSMIANGVFRTCVFTVPFVLANKYVQEEMDRLLTSSSEKSSHSGKAMSLMGMMIPLTNLVMSPIMGPLMAVTGSSWIPIIFSYALTSVSLSVFSFLFCLKKSLYERYREV